MNCQIEPGSILYDSVLFRLIYNGFGEFFPSYLCALDYFLSGFIIILILVNGVLLGAAVLVWGERRLMGRVQNRRGPNRWGPFGLLQPIADLLKLLTKEDLIPATADRLAFTAVPILMVFPMLLSLAVIPIAWKTSLADLNVGVLYVLAIGSLTTLGIFTGGWASGNRYAMFGAMRGVAMLISYEVPVVLSLVAIVLLSGSMAMSDIVSAQSIPFMVVQPLGLMVFVIGISAELNRSPFDIVEAESELIAGFHTEYSGIKFMLIQTAEFGGVLVASAIMATIFLGGWSGPFFSEQLGAVWFLLKMVFFVLMFEWVRFTLPRLRIDQIMSLAWKFLFPLALLNIAILTVEVYFLQAWEHAPSQGELTRGELGIMTGINMVIAVVAVYGFGRSVRQKIAPPVRTARVVPPRASLERESRGAAYSSAGEAD